MGTFKVDGGTVEARKGQRSLTEGALREEMERAFEEQDELDCFLCIENGLYTLVALGPRRMPSRLSWSFQITATTYQRMRRAMRALGLTSGLREKDFKVRRPA